MGLVDTLFKPLEMLINEHGSATILRERIDLIKAQLADQERRYADLLSENKELNARLLQVEDRARSAESELQALRNGQHSGFCCDACGSANVKRTGSRPNQTFGAVGVKDALFTCTECGQVSAFMLEP